MKQLLIVFLGGGLGSVLRYALAIFLNNSGTSIPLGTFTANIAGSLLIGLILGFAFKNQSLSSETVLFLATGFCGGFTTFSTFAYENHVFLKSGDFMSFAIYTLSTFVLGFIMVFAGIWLARFI